MTGLPDPPTPESTRLDLVPARAVLLADGRAWGLALPTPRYRPEVVATSGAFGQPTETVRLVVRSGFPLAITRLVDDLRSASLDGGEAGNARRRFDTLMALAVALLRRAHELGEAEALALLDLDGAGLIRLVDAVLAIVAEPPSRLRGDLVSPCGVGDV